MLFSTLFSPGPGFYKTKSSFEKIPGGKIPFKNGPRLINTTPVDNHPPPDAYFNDAPTDSVLADKFLEKRIVFE